VDKHPDALPTKAPRPRAHRAGQRRSMRRYACDRSGAAEASSPAVVEETAGLGGEAGCAADPAES
jgi:hypothetical protein